MQSLPLVILAVQSSSKFKKKKNYAFHSWLVVWLILLSSIAGLYDKNAEASLIVNGLNDLRRPDSFPRRKHNSQNAQGQLTLMPTSPFGERNHQSMS